MVRNESGVLTQHHYSYQNYNQTTSCQQTRKIFHPLAFLQNTSHAYSINENSIFFAKAIFYVAREKAG